MCRLCSRRTVQKAQRLEAWRQGAIGHKTEIAASARSSQRLVFAGLRNLLALAPESSCLTGPVSAAPCSMQGMTTYMACIRS